MQWLLNLEPQWKIWLAVSLCSGILEIILPSFVMAFTSLAALVAALCAIRYGFWTQLGAFTVTLIFSLILLRPRVIARFHRAPAMPSRSQNLLGKEGIVIEALDTHTGKGRILVEGEDWSARSDQSLSVQTSVIVIDSDGIVLIVQPHRSSKGTK